MRSSASARGTRASATRRRPRPRARRRPARRPARWSAGSPPPPRTAGSGGARPARWRSPPPAAARQLGQRHRPRGGGARRDRLQRQRRQHGVGPRRRGSAIWRTVAASTPPASAMRNAPFPGVGFRRQQARAAAPAARSAPGRRRRPARAAGSGSRAPRLPPTTSNSSPRASSTSHTPRGAGRRARAPPARSGGVRGGVGLRVAPTRSWLTYSTRGCPPPSHAAHPREASRRDNRACGPPSYASRARGAPMPWRRRCPTRRRPAFRDALSRLRFRCAVALAGGYVVAHLGQSLDGRIATARGDCSSSPAMPTWTTTTACAPCATR